MAGTCVSSQRLWKHAQSPHRSKPDGVQAPEKEMDKISHLRQSHYLDLITTHEVYAETKPFTFSTPHQMYLLQIQKFHVAFSPDASKFQCLFWDSRQSPKKMICHLLPTCSGAHCTLPLRKGGKGVERKYCTNARQNQAGQAPKSIAPYPTPEGLAGSIPPVSKPEAHFSPLGWFHSLSTALLANIPWYWGL